MFVALLLNVTVVVAGGELRLPITYIWSVTGLLLRLRIFVLLSIWNPPFGEPVQSSGWSM